MTTSGYLGSVGAPAWLEHEVDLWFLVDISRGMQWDSRFDHTFEAPEATRMCRQHVAAGTIDTVLWVLGPMLMSPASGLRLADRSQTGLVDELQLAVQRREVAEPDGPDWYYLGGVADALEFSLGLRRRFWWVPLPLDLRTGTPARDEHGFSDSMYISARDPHSTLP